MRHDVKINIPDKAKDVIGTIMAAGFEAYVVGGCVRDSVLGSTPEDWDITTSARPEQVKALFPHTVDTGLQHGTVTVMMGREGFEVTTYRIDGKYEDCRHPENVTFTPSLREDLQRRDLTINAMAYNEEQGLVDIFGGMEDISEGIVRCVGDPRERFREDALRILRAIRFSAQLGYVIEEGTRKAAAELAPLLSKISAERIQTELVKLLVSPHPEYLRLAYECKVTAVFLPEFDKAMETPQRHPHHCYSVGEHILASLGYVETDRVLRLAMLFHDIGKPEVMTADADGTTHFHGHGAVGAAMANKIMKRLRFDNDTAAMVCRLVQYHDYGNALDPDKAAVRKAVNRIGEDAFSLLLQVKRADIMAQSDFQREEKLELLERWGRLYEEIVADGQCMSLKDLAVTGRDLIGAGWEPGRKLGVVLQKLLELVLERPDCNTRERLLEEAAHYAQEASEEASLNL